MKKKRLVPAVLLTIAIAAVLVYLLQPFFWNRVYAGVTLEGVDVGGHSREEIIQILSLCQQEQGTKQLAIYYGDTIFRIDPGSIDFDLDIDATVDEVWHFGRKGSPWERVKNIRTALKEGYRIPVKVRYNENKLDQLMEQWKDTIDRPARNATLSIVTGGIIPQEQGRKLEVEKLRPLVVQALKSPDVDNVPLPVALLYPSITVGDLSRTGIRELVGKYSTTFDDKDVNRTTNIKIAANKVNGHIIYPGETFSFNEIVGPREKEYGFKEALEFVDGELVPGIGGGICQVSSTIYNAALLANLAIVERYKHAKPLGYVPMGRDATVVFGALDFKFPNNTASPLMIIAEIEGNKLNVGLFGQSRLKETVEIMATDRQVIPPAIVKQPDNSLFLGETKVDKQGKPGYQITTIRVVRLDGREIKREVLAKDRYQPENTIIKVGSKMPSFAN